MCFYKKISYVRGVYCVFVQSYFKFTFLISGHYNNAVLSDTAPYVGLQSCVTAFCHIIVVSVIMVYVTA